jgi:methyltransferase (TIGR00027 family)
MSKGVEKRPSKTAMGTTLFRAMANYDFSSNKFGSDNLAQYFLPTHYQILLKTQRFRKRMIHRFPSGMYEFFVARTQHFDNLFVEALKKSIPQIVLLGAGYDTRAYRFERQNTNTKVFEVDITTTQSRKIDLLRKAKIFFTDNIKFVSIDFNKDSLESVLSNAGFDTNKQALFLWEGVTYYLEPDSIDKSLESIKKISHAGSSLAFDYLIQIPPEDVHKYYGMQAVQKFMARNSPNEKAKFLLEEGKIDSFLRQRGFDIVDHLNNSEIEEKYLLDESNTLIGHIIGTFRFALASTMNNTKKDDASIKYKVS